MKFASLVNTFCPPRDLLEIDEDGGIFVAWKGNGLTRKPHKRYSHRIQSKPQKPLFRYFKEMQTAQRSQGMNVMMKYKSCDSTFAIMIAANPIEAAVTAFVIKGENLRPAQQDVMVTSI